MIITEEVEIRGKIKRVLELKPYSHTKVEVACDFCGNRKTTSISNHTQSSDRDGKYYCYKCRWIKYEKTCLEKYGFKNASSHEDIKEIRKKSIKEKYNCENVFQLETSKQKSKSTCLKKYGKEFFAQSEEGKCRIKEGFIKNYGYDHFMKNPEEFEKFMKSNLKIKKFENSEIYYQGSNELDFLKKYNKRLKIDNGLHLKYFFKGEIHSYMPDFYLSEFNLLIEIKSNYTWNLHLEKNLAKKDYSIKSGYNFLFIIDKNYTELENIIENYENKQNS
jgi:hypothetical protein